MKSTFSMAVSVKKVIIASIAGVAALFAGAFLVLEFYPETETSLLENSEVVNSSEQSKSTTSGACNIAVIPMNGDVVPFPSTDQDAEGNTLALVDPDTVATAIHAAEKDKSIRGILTVINSYGGDGSAGGEIANDLKRSSLPSVSYIRSFGTSAAYLAATGADFLVASPFAEAGDIGVTMSFLDNTVENQKNGKTFVSLSSAKYKDYMNPDKPMTEEERALIQRDLKIFHEEFVKEVAENRGLSIAAVSKLADGSSMPASLALQNKLIDQLGDKETARIWFAKKLGIPEKEVVFCE